MNKQRTLRTRATKGSTLAEFGPALGLLLICFFFPMIDLCTIGPSYAACFSLNQAQCKEAAMLPEAKASDTSGYIHNQIPEAWRRGIGRFANNAAPPKTVVRYTGQKKQRIVWVSTTFTLSPWICVPLPIKVAGLNESFKFTLESNRAVESATDKS